MRPFDILIAASLLAGAHAQQPTPKPTAKPDPPPKDSDGRPGPSPTGPKTHTIDVGANGYSIEPNRTNARIGDIVEWKFHSGEHWIIRGTLEHPCIPREYFYEEKERLSSGPMKVGKDSDEKPVFRARINATDPVLFYSGAEGACVDHRMMGVINPGPNINLVNYKSRGRHAKFQLRPGDPWPEDEKQPSTTNSNIPTPTEDAPEETSTLPADDEGKENDNEGEDEGLSRGAIAGMAVGGTAALMILGLAVFYCGRRGGVKVLFTNETPSALPQEQFPHYVTPVGVEPPFRPPRTPNTENWRPTMNQKGNMLARTATPEVSMYQQSPPALSPYKTGHGASGYLSAGVDSSAGYAQRHIASYYDPHQNQRTPGSDRPLWTDVQYSRVPTTPIELPTSSDPGNSPLPQYQSGGKQTRSEARKFSWTGTGDDALFRTSRA